MIEFLAPGDLEAVIDRLRTCGVEVEAKFTESQLSRELPLQTQQPQQPVLHVPVPVVFPNQQFSYHGSPPPLLTQGSPERDLTPPANRTLKNKSIEVVPPSQSGGRAQSLPKKRKRPVRGNQPPTSKPDEKRRKSARHTNKSNIPPGSKGYQSTIQAATTKLLGDGNNFTKGFASVQSTAPLSPPISTPLESTDSNEDADASTQSTLVMPPPVKSDDQLIQELMITHDVLSEATKVWNELKERGQTRTKEIDDLQEIQKMWVSLGEELVQHLHSRVVATVGELREVRRQATGQ